MQTQTTTNTKTDAEPTREAQKLKPLRDSIKELENAYELMRAARLAYKEKITAVARNSGFDAGVIRALIAARMAEQSEAAERKAEQARQLAMVFDEVGA